MSNDQTHQPHNQDDFERYIASFPDPADSADFVDDADFGSFDYEMFGCEEFNAFDEQQMNIVADSLRGQNTLAVGPDASHSRDESIPAQPSSQKSEKLDADTVAGTYQPTDNMYPMSAPRPQNPVPQTSTFGTPGTYTTSNQAVPSSPLVGLHFATRVEAQKAFAQRKVAWAWQAPQIDSTLPLNQADREKYVLELLVAFKDISVCQDASSAVSYEERWANLANGQSTYTPEQIEIVCWKLLETTMKLHQYGPASLRIFDTGKLETIHKSRKLNFAARIHLVCDLLRLSKSRCETLVGFDDMEMTVGAPAQMIAMAKTNKKQNKKRQDLLTIGRAALNAKDDAADQQEFEDHDEPDITVVQDRPATLAAPQAPVVQAILRPAAAFYQGRGEEYQDSGHGSNVHTVQPVFEPVFQPGTHRYSIRPKVKKDAGVERNHLVGVHPSGKNKRSYGDYDEAQDELQWHANKRMR